MTPIQKFRRDYANICKAIKTIQEELVMREEDYYSDEFIEALHTSLQALMWCESKNLDIQRKLTKEETE